MKPIHILLGLILILILAFCGLFYVGGTLDAQVSSITAPASDYPAAFTSIRNVIASGSAPQRFTDDAIDDAANYTLVDVTLTLTNRGIFDAEWIDVQVTGVAGDVAVYSLTGEGTDVAARSTGQLNLKIITRAAAESVRRITLQYYTYGISRSITLSA